MWQGRNVNVHVYTQHGLAYAAKKDDDDDDDDDGNRQTPKRTIHRILERVFGGEVVWSVTIEMPNKWRWGWGG